MPDRVRDAKSEYGRPTYGSYVCITRLDKLPRYGQCKRATTSLCFKLVALMMPVLDLVWNRFRWRIPCGDLNVIHGSIGLTQKQRLEAWGGVYNHGCFTSWGVKRSRSASLHLDVLPLMSWILSVALMVPSGSLPAETQERGNSHIVVASASLLSSLQLLLFQHV